MKKKKIDVADAIEKIKKTVKDSLTSTVGQPISISDFSSVAFPLVRKMFPTLGDSIEVIKTPIYSDPINKLMYEAGYDPEPDRIEETTIVKKGLVNSIVSVQPMSIPSGLTFYLDFQYGDRYNRLRDRRNKHDRCRDLSAQLYRHRSKLQQSSAQARVF